MYMFGMIKLKTIKRHNNMDFRADSSKLYEVNNQRDKQSAFFAWFTKWAETQDYIVCVDSNGVPEFWVIDYCGRTTCKFNQRDGVFSVNQCVFDDYNHEQAE